MPELARVRTPLELGPTSAELVEAFAHRGVKLTREQGALLHAHLWFETARGEACFNNNVGNLSTSEKSGEDFYRPAYFEITPSSSADLKAKHADMLAGNAPRAFRAYSSLAAGVVDYVDALLRRFRPIVDAAEQNDPEAVARAIVSTRYTPSVPSNLGSTLASMAREIIRDGGYALLPKARTPRAAMPAALAG